MSSFCRATGPSLGSPGFSTESPSLHLVLHTSLPAWNRAVMRWGHAGWQENPFEHFSAALRVNNQRYSVLRYLQHHPQFFTWALMKQHTHTHTRTYGRRLSGSGVRPSVRDSFTASDTAQAPGHRWDCLRWPPSGQQQRRRTHQLTCLNRCVLS